MVGRLESAVLLAGSIGAVLMLACPQLLDDAFSAGVLPDAGTLEHSRADAASGAVGSGGSVGASNPVLVQALSSGLAHRYSFTGTGTLATDSAGDAHGTLVNTSLDGQGSVSFGGLNQVVNLPNGIVSASNDVTIEAWITWHGGSEWQRLFDFGSNTRGESERGVGVTYLYLVPKGDGVVIVAYTRGGYAGETRLLGTQALPVDRLAHVAVVVDSQTNRMSFFIDGVLNASTALSERLSELDEVNAWIGLSQYAGDPPLQAELTEFRIHRRALGEAELGLSYQLGPDTTLLPH